VITLPRSLLEEIRACVCECRDALQDGQDRQIPETKQQASQPCRDQAFPKPCSLEKEKKNKKNLRSGSASSLMPKVHLQQMTASKSNEEIAEKYA
jgi:hypothetical protein